MKAYHAHDLSVFLFQIYHMHKKPEAKLLPLDTELERTLRNLKKVRFTKLTVMAEQ